MGIFSKLFRKKQTIQPKQVSLSNCQVHNLPAPNRWGEPTRVDIILKVIQYTDADKNEQVRISMSGIGNMNVCLASFLTKGVSYAQEKYNEYKQSPKSEAEFGMSESTKAMLKELAHKDLKKGGKR